MPKLERPPLKPNPFISLRDPETGKWRVIFNFTREGFTSESYKADRLKKDSFKPDSFTSDSLRKKIQRES
ncbi:MAG: hypothetical protein AAFQ40_03030 [Cyanobacteria bacterium J06623_5]